MKIIRIATISVVTLFALASSLAARAEDASSSDPADQVARQFIEAVTTDQIADAYPLLQSSVRKKLTLEQFSTTVVSFRITLGELGSLELEEARPAADACRRRVYLGTFEHADVRFKFDLCEEKEGWRIAYFNTEAVRLDREPLARKLVSDRLAEAGSPPVTGFKCPGIDDAVVGDVVACYAELSKGCVIEIGMQMTANGLTMAHASANAACESLLDSEG